MTAEQKARDMLDRMGVEGAQSFSSGDLVELANLIASRHMDEQRARDILGDAVYETGHLYNGSAFNINWSPTDQPEYVSLEGSYTAEQLEAIAWWMRNKKQA